MSEELNHELQKYVECVLEDTISYAIAPDQVGRILLTDVGEAVVTTEKWCWVTKTRIKTLIAALPDIYTLSGDFIGKKNGKPFPAAPKYPKVPKPLSEVFIGGQMGRLKKFLAGENVLSDGLIRAVSDAEVASCIAIFITNFGKKDLESKPAILKVDLESLGHSITKTPSVFYVLEKLSRNDCSLFIGTEAPLKAATWKVHLFETLYLEDADRSRLAAESLFRLKAQHEVERTLLLYMQHDRVAVRRNVAQALGLPSFLQGFSLNAPTPSREVWLEPGNLQPDSLRQVIDAAKIEPDLEVTQWLLSTLSAQHYGEKLKGLIGELQALERLLNERFGDSIIGYTKNLRAAIKG